MASHGFFLLVLRNPCGCSAAGATDAGSRAVFHGFNQWPGRWKFRFYVLFEWWSLRDALRQLLWDESGKLDRDVKWRAVPQGGVLGIALVVVSKDYCPTHALVLIWQFRGDDE